MAKVEDVAGRILDNCGRMTTMKLQKLTFYCQAAYLAKTGTPIFEEDFCAWVNGPVSPKLFEQHRGKFFIYPGQLDGTDKALPEDSLPIIDAVCDNLGYLTANELVEKTHSEKPWINARKGAHPRVRSGEVIAKKDIEVYYRLHPVI